jgi:hypothetical protein
MNSTVDMEALKGTARYQEVSGINSNRKRTIHHLVFDLFKLMIAATIWLIIVAIFVGFFR